MRMSIKPKGLGGVIFLILAIAVGAIIAYSSGIAHSRSATRIGYIGNNGWSSWSGEYTLLDGKMRRTLHFTDSQSITVEVKTESGTLSVEILDRTGNVVFSQVNMATGSHSLLIDGSITVTISADKHKGSFAIK